jgi:hypothetical protein
LNLKGLRFDTTEEIQAESQRMFDTDSKWLPGSVPKMETVGPVSTCGRELHRGWWRPISLMVNFMIFTASVRNILDELTVVLRRHYTLHLYQYWITTGMTPPKMHKIRLKLQMIHTNFLADTKGCGRKYRISEKGCEKHERSCDAFAQALRDAVSCAPSRQFANRRPRRGARNNDVFASRS